MQGSPRIDELRQKFHENPRRYFAPLANEYRKAGDPEQAIAICRAHLAQQPGHMSGHVVYGQALYDAKRPDEARSVFEKALSLDPDNAIVLRQLGDIARVKGESAEARHWYGKALDIDPLDSEVAAYIAELTEPLTGDVEQSPAFDVEPSPAVDVEPSPAVDVDSPGVVEEVLDEVEKEAQEGVAEATPADDQGDGFEEPATADMGVAAEAPGEEPIFVTSDAPLVADHHEPQESEPSPPIETPEPAAAPDNDSIAAEVAWRNTPQAEKSPFVTRTMAELYATQGYRDSALDIYRQLALQHPDDMEIRDRIDELSAGSEVEVEEPFSFRELADDVIYKATPEDLSLTGEAPPATGDVHFTEMSLGESAGVEAQVSVTEDNWEGSLADFSEISLDDPPADVRSKEPEPVLESTEAPAAETVVEARVNETDLEIESTDFASVDMAWAEEAGVSEADAVLEVSEAESPADLPADLPVEEPVEEPGSDARFVDLPVVLGELQTSIDEAGMAEPSADESAVVAYSPELPAPEDLRHYTPKSPTIREFFATLGAMRPPGHGAPESFTARAAIPEVSAEPVADDLPLATDAFDSLFPDDPPVSEEDTRAAFALSGAMSGATHNPVPSSLRTSPPLPSPAVTDPSSEAQESEEDIRRFREWLDGLADS